MVKLMSNEVESGSPRRRFDELNLDHVFVIEGNRTVVEDDMPKLRRSVARSILKQPFTLTGQELRYLRSEMGLSQIQIAEFLHVNRHTPLRWEAGKIPLDSRAQILIRTLAQERLDLDPKMSVAEISYWVGKPRINNATIEVLFLFNQWIPFGHLPELRNEYKSPARWIGEL